MSAIGRRLIDTITASLSGFTMSSNEYQPTVNDVLETKECVRQASNNKLPIEVIDEIIDFAEYWPHSSTVMDGLKRCEAKIGGRGIEDTFCLRSLPVGYNQDSPSEAKYTLSMKTFAGLEPVEILRSEIRNSKNNITNKVLENWKLTSPHRGQYPCRKIVFTIESKDQGWVSTHQARESYKGSFSWFDVGKEGFEALEIPENPYFSRPMNEYCQLISGQSGSESIYCVPCTLEPGVVQTPSTENTTTYKIKHPFLPTPASLQSNIVAGKTIKKHLVTWKAGDNVQEDSPEALILENKGRGRATGNGNFVKDLQVGDIITVWARARFPGWKNDVSKISIDIYWAV